MRKVTVKRDELLAKVRENKEQHREVFEKALEGYRVRAVEILEDHIARIKDGKVERVFVQLPVPEDHTDDYARVEAMLEASVDQEIDLTDHEFDSYWRDVWHWTDDFVQTSMRYTDI